MKTKIIQAAKVALIAGSLFGMVTMVSAVGTTSVSSSTSAIGSTSTSASTTTTSASTGTTVLSSGSGSAGTTDPCSTSGSTAWHGPTATPPGANVAAPINASSTPQFKDGKITIGSLPCPIPASGFTWTPPSKLTVNGITDTYGFSNWGATFLQGLTSIGATWTRPTYFPAASKQPKLFVQADPLVGAVSSTNLPQPAAQFKGDVGILGGSLGIVQADGRTVVPSTPGASTIYVQGIPVCLRDGTNCPASTASTGGVTSTGTASFIPEFTSPSALGNSHLHDYGTFMSFEGGTSVRIDSGLVVNEAGTLTGLDGGIRIGATSGGEGIGSNRSTNTLDLYTAGVNRMSISNSGNVTVHGQSVCLGDGTGCPNTITMYAVINSPTAIVGSSARTCDDLSDDGHTVATAAYSPYGPGTLVTHAYCERSGTYWALPVAGHLNP